MSDLVTVALITGLCTGIPNLIAQLVSYRKLHQVSKEMNGMKEELVRTTGKEAYAAGREDQKKNPEQSESTGRKVDKY